MKSLSSGIKSSLSSSAKTVFFESSVINLSLKKLTHSDAVKWFYGVVHLPLVLLQRITARNCKRPASPRYPDLRVLEAEHHKRQFYIQQ